MKNLQIEEKKFKGFVDKEIQTKGEEFVKKIKNKEDKDKIKTFKTTTPIILDLIGKDIKKNFDNINNTNNTNKKTPNLQTYKDAIDAFNKDMNTLEIIDDDIKKLLNGIQDFIDLKEINIRDFPLDRLNHLRTVATDKDFNTQITDLLTNKVIPGTGRIINKVILGTGRIKLIAEIDAKITKIKGEETTTLENKKIDYRTMNAGREDFITKFFEGDQKVYNAILQDVFNEKTDNKTATFTITKETKGQANNLYQRVEAYIKTAYPEIIDIGEIELGKADTFDGTKNRFSDEERVIKYQIQEIKDKKGNIVQEASEEKFIVRGNKIEIQKRIAEKNKTEIEKLVKEINRTETYRRDKNGIITEKGQDPKPTETEEVKASLNRFDGIGNFEAFRNFLDDSDANTIKKNLHEIIPQIMNYNASTDTADALENPNDLKNGYANVFTNYMMKQNDSSILKTYMGYITKENLNLLGVDEATRINNYNRLFFSDAKNNILRPEITEILKNMNEDEKKVLLENIAQVRIAITNEKNGGTVENLKQGFDAFIDAFGPALFGILGLLGISKATLLKWSPTLAEKINEKFAEEYGLSPEATTALQKIAGNENFTANEITTYGDLSKAESLKKAYYGEIAKNYKTIIESNYQHINVNVFRSGLELYNKKTYKNDTAKYININDIVNIKTKDDKEYIDSLKNKDKYNTIIETLIDDNSTRSRIANANADIQTPATNKEKLTTNKQGLEENDYYRYNIKSQKDIVRYLTTSLFSDKDLSYVMTENQLNNGANIEGGNTEKIEDTEEKLNKVEFNIDMYNNTTGVTVLGGSKMIHDIIDMKTAPDEIQITRQTDDTKINCTLNKNYTDSQITIVTPTYIDDTGKRVYIYVGDKIEAVQTPEYRYQENDKKIGESIQEIIDNKYKTFDFTTFEYNAKAAGDQQKYQDKLLTPINDILTDKEQFKLLFSDTRIDGKMTAIGPINLKNTFLMMDSGNSPKKYDEITGNIENTVTSIEAKNNVITITQDTGTITIKYDGDELKTERKEKPAS